MARLLRSLSALISLLMTWRGIAVLISPASSMNRVARSNSRAFQVRGGVSQSRRTCRVQIPCSLGRYREAGDIGAFRAVSFAVKIKDSAAPRENSVHEKSGLF